MDFFSEIFGKKNSPKIAELKISETPMAEIADMGIRFIDECIDIYEHEDVTYGQLQSWNYIKAQSLETRADICLWAFSEMSHADKSDDRITKYRKNAVIWAKLKLGRGLLRFKLPFTQIQLAEMISWSIRDEAWHCHTVPMIKTVKRILGNDRPCTKLENALWMAMADCVKVMDYSNNAENRAILKDLTDILDPDVNITGFSFPKGNLLQLVEADLAEIDKKQKDSWNALFEFASSASGASPKQKWLQQGGELVKPIGKDNFQGKLLGWLENTLIDPEKPDNAIDILKGMIWLSAHTPGDDMAFALGKFAEKCYKKVPGVGSRSMKLGNACCVTLANMPENMVAIAELVRLRSKIKYPSVRDNIQKMLEKIAKYKSISLAELEDSCLPDFGFDMQGKYTETLGDYKAIITLDGNKAVLGWSDKNGKERKTVPKAIRENFKPELTKLKQRTKDLSGVLSGQIKNLEQVYVNDRDWDFASWQELYLHHPVRRKITQSLLWHITDKDKSYTVIPTNAGLEDISGNSVKPPKTALVRLWHPLFEKTDAIIDWRRRIENLKITQPFKQAHREIYVATDAELRTKTYSNRFAAHILRQHQLKALCEARGWTYRLQGMWDDWDTPKKQIPAFDIIVEYMVGIFENNEQSDYGIHMYLTTDLVRFFSPATYSPDIDQPHDSNQMNIADVPAIVFSEIMRDIDLFVAITSVANDPNWADAGHDRQFGTYWHDYAFGELGETAKTRKSLIAELIPKLSIADRLEVGEKFLTVRGNLHEYKIHLGSGNIMIMPDNRYLCIVRGVSSRKMDKIYLPFAGDDLLSTILSKAFMLANDDKITDETILSQL